MPYLDLRGSDVFEQPDFLDSGSVDLPHIAAVLLLKIKILLDLSSLDQTALVGTKVPQEILDVIREQTVSTKIVLENKKLAESTDHKAVVTDLNKQIAALIKWTSKANKHFLPAIIEPRNYLTARPSAYSHGSAEQMYLALQYSYDSWSETPGAIGYLKTKLAK